MTVFDMFYNLFIEYIFSSNITGIDFGHIPVLFASFFTFLIIAMPIYFILKWIFGSKRKWKNIYV